MYDKNEILNKVDKLINMYKKGELGGEVMTEDANPRFESCSNENYLYFTLPMALNYQRNSYNYGKVLIKLTKTKKQDLYLTLNCV